MYNTHFIIKMSIISIICVSIYVSLEISELKKYVKHSMFVWEPKQNKIIKSEGPSTVDFNCKDDK